MAFYDPDPEAMRVIRLRESSQRLLPDAANIASMLYLASRTNPQFMELIRDQLVRTLHGLHQIRAENLGGYDLMSLRQDVENAQGSWKAQPDQISDGTLRALAVLVALFQGRIDKQSATSLVGIEEPETGLHPAAADVLFNALVDASHTTQVLVTTHSTALLDSDDVDVESLLAVVSENGSTVIGPIDDVGRSILRDHLFTVGELLQMEQLRPEAPSESPTDAPGAPMPVGPTR
jgi:predicted ATPase